MSETVLKYVVLIFFPVFLLQCIQKESTEKTVVAEVNGTKLTVSDLDEIIPNELNKGDSAVMAEDYIKKWIMNELMIQKANENLSVGQKDVSKELREYRNSLIIYKYKNELMKQQLDTVVTDVEIEDYYAKNTGNFNLGRNIVKAIFVKVPNEVSKPSLLKSLAADESEEGLGELREYCLQYAKAFDIFTEWVDFELVKKNVPVDIDNVSEFLSRNKQIELNDSNYYYLVRIHAYKLQNETAPKEYVKNNIKNLIHNQRKLQFLKQLEKNIFEEGIKKKKFKIYINEE